MGRDHLRLAVWALAIVTSFAIFGDDTAYAWNNQPRVMAGGLFFKDDPTNLPAGSDKVRFGVTGRCDILGTTTVGSSSTCVSPRGRFEYHNKFTGLKARGRITSLTFEPVLATDGCATDAAGGDSTLIGKPSAKFSGNCDDGSCSFSMKVVDANANGSGSPDWVCNVNVTDNKHAPDNSFGAPLIKGDVEIKNGTP